MAYRQLAAFAGRAVELAQRDAAACDLSLQHGTQHGRHASAKQPEIRAQTFPQPGQGSMLQEPRAAGHLQEVMK